MKDREQSREEYEALTLAIEAQVRRSYRQPRPDCDHDDLVNDVWVKLCESNWKRLRGYDPSRGVPRTAYVKLIAKRVVYDRLRRERRWRSGSAPESQRNLPIATFRPIEDGEDFASPGPSPEELTQNGEVLQQLEDFLRPKLSERELRFFRLRFQRGLDYDQIERIFDAKSRAALQNASSKILRLCHDASTNLALPRAARGLRHEASMVPARSRAA